MCGTPSDLLRRGHRGAASLTKRAGAPRQRCRLVAASRSTCWIVTRGGARGSQEGVPRTHGLGLKTNFSVSGEVTGGGRREEEQPKPPSPSARRTSELASYRHRPWAWEQQLSSGRGAAWHSASELGLAQQTDRPTDRPTHLAEGTPWRHRGAGAQRGSRGGRGGQRRRRVELSEWLFGRSPWTPAG